MRKLSKNPKERCIINIYANDRKDLLIDVLSLFSKISGQILYFNVGRTDIQELLLVTIEVDLPPGQLIPTLFTIEKSIEVLRVTGNLSNEQRLSKIAYYRLATKSLCPKILSTLQQFGVTVTEMSSDSFIVQKSGSEDDLTKLYNRLEGKDLLSFSIGIVPVSESLIQLDELFIDRFDQAEKKVLCYS